ncbi:hypothetical protein Ancab_013507 [Ancistrocladus abbreviatus]
MGSLGSDGNGTEVPVNKILGIIVDDTEPQDYDSQFSPSFDVGNGNNGIADDLQFIKGTVPYDDFDTVAVNDAFDTQLVDFDGETQLMNIDPMTQVMDIAGETQVLDDYDHIQLMDTQVLDEFDNEAVNRLDGEESDRTEVLSVTEASTDTKSPRRNGDQISGGEEIEFAALSHEHVKGLAPEPVRSADVPCSSGSLGKGFTYIRTAAIRAFGLAARNTISKVADGASCSNLSSSHSSEQCTARDNGLSNAGIADQEHDMGENDAKQKGLRDENESRIGSKTARKLFMDEIDTDEEESNSKMNDVDAGVMLQTRGCDNELAGLSYLNSEEPGDLSQANALEFVDRFLKVNVFDFEQERRNGNASSKKTHPESKTKGTQSLAKKADSRSMLEEARIFDWDDSREDEGGGEFFTKKKDVLFGASFCKKKSCSEPWKSRHHAVKGDKLLEKSTNTEQLLNMDDKIMGLVRFDSKLVPQKSRKADKLEGISIKRNLNNDLDEQRHSDSPDVEVEAVSASIEMPEMLNIGVDTQMAAEAMEVLANGVVLATNVHNCSHQGDCNSKGTLKKQSKKRGASKRGFQTQVCLSRSEVITRSKQTKVADVRLGDALKSSVASRTHSCDGRREVVIGLAQANTKRRRLNTGNSSIMNGQGTVDKMQLTINNRAKEGILERWLDKEDCVPAKTQCLKEKFGPFTSVARRTRRQMAMDPLNGVGGTLNDARGKMNSMQVVCVSRDETKSKGGEHAAPEVVNTEDKTLKLTTFRDGIHCEIGGLPKASIENGHSGESVTRRKRSKRKARKPAPIGKGFSSGGTTLLSEHTCQTLSSRKNDACSSPHADGAEACRTSGVSAGDQHKLAITICTTPVNTRTPVNAASPVCMGNEYYKQSCKKNLTRLSLLKELNSLTDTRHERASYKDLRKRKDMGNVRVLFSHHLDEDVIRQQKKILGRLGAALASSISEATHFVTDKFVRTRNMLEAIACGKLVVTHLWLESCGQASCFIDEKNFILRDAKKEKEFGFSMPVTLARASQHPLLEDRRVLITPSTKPGVEIISSLVRAVHGQAIEKISRSLFKDDKLLDDLLVLSCEEDYEVCVPLLEKGTAIYSSELLLNGIVTQKLEYERHMLFVDHVKRTRSTLWMKKDGKQFIPVNRRK